MKNAVRIILAILASVLFTSGIYIALRFLTSWNLDFIGTLTALVGMATVTLALVKVMD